MEEKVRRECKVYIEKLFKKADTIGAGAIPKLELQKILDMIIPQFNDKEELDKLLKHYAKRNKHTTMNPKTKQIEYQYMDDTLDFPSVLAIAVYFLAKTERRESNAFAGQGLIKVSDLSSRPSITLENTQLIKKRLF